MSIFPVRWWDWREFTLSFTPVGDGTVDLVTQRPVGRGKDGSVIPQGSPLGRPHRRGDSDSKTAASSPNPVASRTHGTRITATTSPPMPGRSPAPSRSRGNSSPPPGRAARFPRLLKVKAGQNVTLKLHAKAATLPGFVPPKRLGQDTPAHRALGEIKRGVNLGNCWDAPPPYSWGIRYTPDDIDRIAAEGFDHIRVPVAWHFNMKPGANGLEIDPALLTDLEPVLRRALEKKLHVLLDWHHFDELTDDPAGKPRPLHRLVGNHRPPFQIVAAGVVSRTPQRAARRPHHRGRQSHLRGNHRRHPRVDPQAHHPRQPRKMGRHPRARQTPPARWRRPDRRHRPLLRAVLFHPSGSRLGQTPRPAGIVYPGPPATPFAIPDSLKENAGLRSFIEGYNTLPAERNPCSANTVRELLDLARDWSAHFGRPVHLGEFGSHDTATKPAAPAIPRRQDPGRSTRHPLDAVGLEGDIRLLGYQEQPAAVQGWPVRLTGARNLFRAKASPIPPK